VSFCRATIFSFECFCRKNFKSCGRVLKMIPALVGGWGCDDGNGVGFVYVFECFGRTRLKGLPVISREHFCKTHTNCYEILPCSIITSNTKIGTSNTNCYFKYQLLLQIPIVTSNTNCYFNYQLLLRIPKLVL
jgi:hypothetical protein